MAVAHERNAAKRKGAGRRRKPGDRYTTDTYRRCIERACERAGVPAFTPHQLRHLAATRIRSAFGLDVARAVCGHTTAAMTEHYAKAADRELALKAVAAFG